MQYVPFGGAFHRQPHKLRRWAGFPLSPGSDRRPCWVPSPSGEIQVQFVAAGCDNPNMVGFGEQVRIHFGNAGHFAVIGTNGAFTEHGFGNTGHGSDAHPFFGRLNPGVGMGMESQVGQ